MNERLTTIDDYLQHLISQKDSLIDVFRQIECIFKNGDGQRPILYELNCLIDRVQAEEAYETAAAAAELKDAFRQLMRPFHELDDIITFKDTIVIEEENE